MNSTAQKIALTGLFVLALVGLSPAQEHKGVVYKLPSGWQEATEGEGKVFTPKNLRKGEVVAVVLTSAQPATDEPAKKQFETAVTSANGESKIISKGEVTVTSSPSGSVCLQAFDMEAEDVGKHARIYAMIIVAKKRALAIVILKPDTLASKYQDDVMSLVGSLKIKVDSSTSTSSSSSGKTPTGNTPDLYPGQVGWLPSGKGLAIPASDIVNGKPQGIFWTTSYGTGTKVATFVFLPSGVHASNPRFGGGMLFDVEGQKAAPGANGVGPWSISGGKIHLEHDGFKSSDPYTTGSDSSGKFFKSGAALYRPLQPMTKATLVGTWQFPGNRYIFRADGTYEFGQVTEGGGWIAGSTTQGTYSIDGHLVVLRQADGTLTITPMGTPGPNLLIANGIFYKKG